ncbi:MAG: apolipoprotein N-acyltransferase, partial [Spirochaetales bacterium]|nr:apolipoprotein N-acyltransferase [Spirochaetales bacterium]
MLKTMSRPLVLSLLSGLLLPLALPNEFFLFGFPLLGCVCLAPYFTALARCRSWGRAALCSVVFCLVSTPLSNFWLAFFKDFAFLTIGAVTAAYCVLFIGFGAILWKFSRTGPYRPLLIAAFWMTYEFIKSTGYFAYPWGLIVYPVNTLLPLMQIADIAGLWPLSFLMALTNSLFAEFFLRLSRPWALSGEGPEEEATPLLAAKGGGRQSVFEKNSLIASGAFAALLALGFTGYGLFRMAEELPSAGNLKTVLVQQNTDPWVSGSQERNLLTVQKLSREGAAQFGGKPDIVLWSESSLSSPYKENAQRFENYPSADPFSPFARALGSPLLTGSPILIEEADGARRFQNAVILIDSQARIAQSYAKRHPVPMAEHIPLWEFAPVRKFFQDVVGIRSIWSLGSTDTIFTVKTSEGKDIRFGSPICFEDAFPYLCRNLVKKGADLLLNLTNDAWSRTNSAQIQHFVVARFRSIEMKRVLVRSTNGGLTAVIGPFGEIQASLPMFEAASLAAEISVTREESLTPYTVYGDWLPITVGIFLIGVLA